MSNSPVFLYVDLFCGAGGTTTGIEQAYLNALKLAKVIACVNHDPKAIKSHWLNHPDVKHFTEDIRTLDLTELVAHVRKYRELYPDAYLVLWASLECTNFSKAKGGMSRDPDSRTLAEHLFRYIQALQPDYIQIENVVEFRAWGPMRIKAKAFQPTCTELATVTNKKTGKISYYWIPNDLKKGQDFIKWTNNVCSYGYYQDWKEMNSADYGAYTSRNRLFGCFARHGLPMTWPEPTHSKKALKIANKGELPFDESVKPWKPVKEVLDFTDEGYSIFDRENNMDIPKRFRKALSEKTLQRIFQGLIKHVAGGKKAFLVKYLSNNAKTGLNNGASIDQPSPTITTQRTMQLAQVVTVQSFITQRNGGNPESKSISIEQPARTLTGTGGNQDLIQLKRMDFLCTYYSTGTNCSSINVPSPTLRTTDGISLIQPKFWIDKHYSGAHNHQSIDQPAGTLLSKDKMSLIKAEPGAKWLTNTLENRKWYYLMNPQYLTAGTSVEQPCFTLIARTDKAPPYLVVTEEGKLAIQIYETDSPATRQIKEFMALYGIADIKMRMLRVKEMLKIQGFPEDYQLIGSQKDQKKSIGNSVVPAVVEDWVIAMARPLLQMRKAKIA